MKENNRQHMTKLIKSLQMLEFKRPLVVVDIRYEDTDTEELVFKMFCQCPFLMLFISSVSNIFCHSILFS